MQTDEDEINLNGEAGVSKNTRIFPATGIPFAFYPYVGKNRSPGYMNPVVAVKFNNISVSVDYLIRFSHFTAYARDFRLQCIR